MRRAKFAVYRPAPLNSGIIHIWWIDYESFGLKRPEAAMAFLRSIRRNAEAVQRPTMRFVPLKGDEQLDLQALHRVRSRLVGERTAVINQIRGFLLEHGITVRQGPAGLRQALPKISSPCGILWAVRAGRDPRAIRSKIAPPSTIGRKTSKPLRVLPWRARR
jgi:hypothetical protein